MKNLHALSAFRHDPEYLLEMRKIAIPIIIQQFMFSGLNMLGVIFVGQKGDVAAAFAEDVGGCDGAGTG